MNTRVKAMALAMMVAVAANAQIGNVLKNVIGNAASGTSTQTNANSAASTALSGVGDIIKNLIGTKAVTAESLNGTWNYTSPAVAFESSNLLQNAGGTVMANTLEKKMQTYLSKIGFTPGKVIIKFENGKDFTMTIGSKTINGTYTVEGSEITLTRQGLLSKPVTANLAVSINELQMTFKADKLLTFITNIASLSGNATLGLIGKMAGSYDGMQMGFTFSKQ